MATSSLPRIVNARCEGMLNPLGVGAKNPRLSWEIEDSRRGARSVAWQIQLRAENKAQLWDSGKSVSNANEAVYAGEPLECRGRYEWRVKAFMDNDAETAWSDYASFECGFFSIADWPGHWTPYQSNMLRKDQLSVNHLRGEFSLPLGKRIRRARAYVAATAAIGILGNDALRMNLYELRINGRKVGLDLINPGQLSLKRGRALFRTFDISSHISERNAVGLITASAIISAQIIIDFEDGGTFRFGSGPGWRMIHNKGPFKRLWKCDVKEYGGRGEFYDAREELAGWDMPGFDDSSWRKLYTCSQPDILAPQTFALQLHETVAPKSIERLPSGNQLVDFGRNFNGFAKVILRGKAGDAISLRFGELRAPSGEVSCDSCSWAPEFDQLDTYIKKSDEPEEYAPTFATHGFRFMSVEGQKEDMRLSDAQGCLLGVPLPNRSSFHCSDERINRLHKLCIDSFRANMLSVPSDCAGRERNGWVADGYLVTDAEYINFDAAHLFRKWYDDICDMQESDGYVPCVCPFPFQPYSRDIIWAACFTLTVWQAYRNSGDKAMLRHLLQPMIRLGEHLAETARSSERIEDFIFYNGDHIAEKRPGVAFLGYSYCYRNLDTLAKICEELGEGAKAFRFSSKANAIKSLINERFINAQGLYDNNTQSANAHALHFGIAEGARRQAVIDALAADLERQPAFNAGMLGYFSLMEGLADAGRNDAIWLLVTSDEPGAWGSWIKNFDATTASEVWYPNPFEAPHKNNSWSHPMLVGGLSSWLYRRLAGIAPITPGYGRISIRPFFAPGIENVEACIDTPKGLVKCHWRKTGRAVEMSFSVPVNAEAEICIPCAEASFDGLTPAGESGKRKSFLAQSGSYEIKFTETC